LEISCIILAGGKSVRYGHDKILEKINNTNLLDRVISQLEPISKDIIIVTANERAFTHLADRKNIRIVNDIIPGMGSLGGVYTGLVESRTHQNLVVAADMPFLNRDLLRYMIDVADGYDFTLPHINEWYEPLHAIYSKNCIASARAIFDQGKKVIVELFNYVKVRYVEAEEIDRYDPQHLSFFNINTRQDMERALKIMEGTGS
jgi:molybdopterin-guanine dinucleotide biosynthesis protein A